MDNIKRGLGDLKPQNLFGKDDQEQGFAEVVADNAVDALLAPFAANDLLTQTLAPQIASLSLRKVGLFSWGAVGAKFLHDNFLTAVQEEVPALPSVITPPTPPPSPSPSTSPTPISIDPIDGTGDEEEKETEKENVETQRPSQVVADDKSKVDDMLQKAFTNALYAIPTNKRKADDSQSGTIPAEVQWSKTDTFLPINPIIIDLALTGAAPPYVLDRLSTLASNAANFY